MDEQFEMLHSVIKHADIGQLIKLQYVDISVVFISDPLFFILPSNETEKEIWVKISHDILSNFLGQEVVRLLLDNLKEKQDSVLISEKPLFVNITIRGKVTESVIPIEKTKNTKVIEATLIEQNVMQTWKRGSTLFREEEKSHLFLNEGLRKRIGNGLLQYVNTNIFGFLNNELLEQFEQKKEKKYLVIECGKCCEVEIYHAFELSNRLCNPNLCRKCCESKYKNLIEVPFSDTFVISLFSDFRTFFEEYMHRQITPPDALIDRLLRFSKLDHPLEIGVVYDDIRNYIKELFQEDNYNMMIKLEAIIGEAKKNENKFMEFIGFIEKFSTVQSLQTTSDTTNTYKEIVENADNKFKNFYFPNPVIANPKDDYVDLSEINEVSFNAIINLYKDTFDLTGDHWFLSNLAKVLKNAPIIEDCITPDLYGENLVNKTLRYTKKTELHDIVEAVYNVKIRNAIAHPGRVIDYIKQEIHIFDKGELIETFTINDFKKIVEKLITFHVELTYVKYRLVMHSDQRFLSTGGILSFQPDFFTKPDENEKPHLIINQLSNFEKFMPSYNWWVENINLDIVETGNGKGIRFFVNRSESNCFETPSAREVIFGISAYIREWIELALKQGEIVVTHRTCYIPVDIKAGEENLNWIPINIPIFPLDGEHEVFVKSMRACGILIIDDKIRGHLSKLIESLS